MSRPNILLAGGARCGTTSLAKYLQTLPEVGTLKNKEPHYLAFWPTPPPAKGPGDVEELSRQAVIDSEEYEALWDEDAAVRIDASVTTMHYPERSIPNIKRLCPDTRLVFILRNPIERAWSGYWYQKSRGYEDLEFAPALDAETLRKSAGWGHMWHYLEASKYRIKLEPFFEAFPRDQIMVTRFENIFGGEGSQVADLLNFIGGTADPSSSSALPHYNASGSTTGLRGAAAGLVLRSPLLRRTIRAILPNSVSEKARSRMLQTPVMGTVDRRRLSDELRSDVEHLSNLVGQDFTDWLGDTR